MRKSILLALALALIPIQSPAQSSTARVYVTFATESITVAGTALGFTAATIAPVGGSFRAGLVTFVVECASASPCPIRILTTTPVTAPTASVGIKLNEGDIVSIYGFDDISSFRAIRTTANSAVIQPQYSR
jgi:hypothetical protein